jgi:phosphatidylglycerophosphate synthase
VTSESPPIYQFVVLADESARWMVAGLTQLDRLLLAINEFAASTANEADISAVIFWRPDIPSKLRWLPNYPSIKKVHSTESLSSAHPDAHVISTRLFVDRNGLAEFVRTTLVPKLEELIVNSPDFWNATADRFDQACASLRTAGQGTQYLADVADLPACEKRFLRRAGKSQDGLVSRILNRPISRAITRLLLRYPIDPTSWTLAIFILPIAAFFFLLRGDYAGVLAGAVIFQLYSILDGCDGEIARAKYLETTRGGRIDDFLDTLGSVLFVIGLGAGLSRSHHFAYGLEGVLCAAVIVSNEMILRLSRTQGGLQADSLTRALYPRHREMIQKSGLLLLGETNAWWLIQFTKRDVAMFIFLLLAIANLGQWILHLWITVSTVTLALTARTHVRRSDALADS